MAVAGPRETVALFSLLRAVSLIGFCRSSVPITYLIFPPLLLLAFRASTTGVAIALLLASLIARALPISSPRRPAPARP